jgi:hypothetical protein
MSKHVYSSGFSDKTTMDGGTVIVDGGGNSSLRNLALMTDKSASANDLAITGLTKS